MFLFWHPKETPTQTIQTLETLETDTPSLNKYINHCMSYDKFYFVLTEVLSVLLYGSMSLDWPSGYLKDRKCAIYLNSAAQLNLYASLLEKKTNMKKPDACIFPWLHALIQHLTWEVDFCEGISGCGPCCCQQVDWLVIDMVAVAKVQPGEQRHLSTYEA